MKNNRKKQIKEILKNMHKIRRLFSGETMCYYQNKPITNTQFIVLGLIKNKENIGIKEIAQTLGITCSAVTQIINNLTKNKYINKRISSADRRNIKIKLSKNSRKNINYIENKLLKNFYNLFESLNDKELSTFCKLNSKITKNLIGPKNLSKK
ncbi:MAG: MarR family transcriptional regulator [Patescibacteria group bacterium]|nr:MarR family transcriptional regulator [Patescibacteria group bacterium]